MFDWIKKLVKPKFRFVKERSSEFDDWYYFTEEKRCGGVWEYVLGTLSFSEHKARIRYQETIKQNGKSGKQIIESTEV